MVHPRNKRKLAKICAIVATSKSVLAGNFAAAIKICAIVAKDFAKDHVAK
jgi:hypothetical protein